MTNDDITIPDGKNAGYILVHADGGDCHGTPLIRIGGLMWSGHMCPKCRTSPDMQSTEFWRPSEVRR